MQRNMRKSDITNYILFVIRKRKLLLWWVALSTFLSVIFFSYLITPTWEGTTKILVERSSKQNLSIFKDVNLPVAGSSDKSNMDLLEILTGENMAYDIVAEFHLDEQLRNKRYAPRNFREKAKNLIANVIYSPRTLLVFLGVLTEGEKDWTEAAAEDFIEDWQDIEAVEGLSIIELTINGESRQQAMDIANRMVELLSEKTRAFTRSGALSSYAFVQEQLELAEQEMSSAEAALSRFLDDNDIVLIEEEKRLKLARLDSLEAELSATRKQRQETTARLEEVMRELERQPEKLVLETVIARNPVATELESTLQALETKLASLLTEKREKHPDVQKVNAEIYRNREALKSIVQEITQTQKETYNPLSQTLLGSAIDLRADSMAIDARAQTLQRIIESVQKELKLLIERESQLDRLEMVAKIKTATYESLKKRADELAVEKDTNINEYNIRVLDRAFVSPSADPDWPIWLLNIIAALFLSCTFGFGIIFVIEYWNDPVIAPRDVEVELAMPLMGTVPEFGKKDL